MGTCICADKQADLDRRQMLAEHMIMPGANKGLIDYKPVSLNDKPLLAPIIAAQHFENSELTFPDIYIWRKSWHVEWAIVENALYMRMRMPGQCLLYPVMPIEGELTRDMVQLAVEDMRMREVQPLMTSVGEGYLEELRRTCPEDFTAEELRDFFDYMYGAYELRELPGKRYHGKRNHVSQFTKAYGAQAQYRPLTKADKRACLGLWEEWYAKREPNMDDTQRIEAMQERDMVLESFNAMDELGLRGGVVEIDGRMAAFTLGEREHDILYVRLEKADDEYKGIYAYINQQFVQNGFEGINWVDREEDMGIPGLRKSKESYYPHHMVKKYMLDFSQMK